MKVPPILFFHSLDAENRNAQSNNIKEILARWDSDDLPAAGFYFREPDPRVACNPNVKLIKLPPNRLWKARALAGGLGRLSGVVYPGLSASFDDSFRRMRRIIGRREAIISTLEGVPADQRFQSAEEDRFSDMFGHRVYCQAINPDAMASLSRVKAHSNLLIAISPFLEKVARDIYPGVKTRDIPLGVNIEYFHPRGRVPHGRNKRLKVLCAASFQVRKRPHVFLELARARPDVDFIWYGDGELRAELQSQASREGLSNLTLPGVIDSEGLACAFRRADIFTLPSVAEGVPKVTQEAAACGLPVVCMQYYEPFSVSHGINGFLAKDDIAYTAHIETLIDDPQLRARMGAAGSKMALDWNWDILSKRWQTAITETIQRVAAE